METTASWAAPAPASAAPTYRISALLGSLLTTAAVLSDYLFWHESAGLNVLVYMVFLVVAHLVLLPRHAPVRRTAGFWAVVGGCVLSGGLVAWYGSSAAVLAALASGLLLVGFVNQSQLRLLGYAALTAAAGVLPAVGAVLGSIRAPRRLGGRLRRGWFYGRVLGVPLLAVGIFQALFAAANPRFAALSARFWNGLAEWLGQLFVDISIPHLLFFMVCLVGAAGALVVVPIHFFLDHESRFGEYVRRQRDRVASLGVRRPSFRHNARPMLDLRKEWLAAVVSFGLLNALLLVVNVVDINWIWLGFDRSSVADLTQFVHEGTYVLIFSILLAAGIMLWFFRRNLNFYQPGLPLLRWGATAWVLQNVVLAISVGLRNYYYIVYTGLAYKRIGVYGFLLLTLFGLGTVLLKIWQRRSAFHLVRLNSWATYAVLLALAAGNWEIWIAEYNLQAGFSRVDIGFLLRMPARVLPVLAERAAIIEQTPQLVAEGDDGYYHPLEKAEAKAQLQQKLATFRHDYRVYDDWQSRTGAEYLAHKKLTGHE